MHDFTMFGADVIDNEWSGFGAEPTTYTPSSKKDDIPLESNFKSMFNSCV